MSRTTNDTIIERVKYYIYPRKFIDIVPIKTMHVMRQRASLCTWDRPYTGLNLYYLILYFYIYTPFSLIIMGNMYLLHFYCRDETYFNVWRALEQRRGCTLTYPCAAPRCIAQSRTLGCVRKSKLLMHNSRGVCLIHVPRIIKVIVTVENK